MAKHRPDRPIIEKIAAVIVFTAGSLTVVGLGRKLFLKRGIGPGLRWVYTTLPEVAQLQRATVGMLPILHEEALTLLTVGETIFTLGFWGVYTFERRFEAIVDSATEAFVAGLTLRPVRDVPDFGLLIEDIPKLILGGQPPPRQFDFGVATSVSSPAGVVAFGTQNAWEIDP